MPVSVQYTVEYSIQYFTQYSVQYTVYYIKLIHRFPYSTQYRQRTVTVLVLEGPARNNYFGVNYYPPAETNPSKATP